MTTAFSSAFGWEPGSEQEILVLFGRLLNELPIPLVIDEVRTKFPDCIAHRADTGEILRIEFELYGANFWSHKHDPLGCDVVICWRDNWRTWPPSIHVIELAEIARRVPRLVQADRPKRLRTQWEKPKFDHAADADTLVLVEELADRLMRNQTFELRYNGCGKDATCNVCVRDSANKVLWIWADGRYQWCWDSFRSERPDVVDHFQRAVASTNPTARHVAKPRSVAQIGTTEILRILNLVGSSLEPSGGPVASILT